MICKEAILNYERLKSIKAGLLHKTGRLETLLTEAKPDLFDKILLAYNTTLEIIRAREKEILKEWGIIPVYNRAYVKELKADNGDILYKKPGA